MLSSEIFVWMLAVIINTTFLIVYPIVYNKTQFLQLSHKILTSPWPFWSIILLSAVGAFASVILDDDFYDIVKSKKEKAQLYFTIGVFSITFVLYFLILKYTHINIKVF